MFDQIYSVTSASTPPAIQTQKIIQDAVEDELVPAHLIQIKATPDEVRRRIDAFITRKREDVNRINVRDFCTRSWHQMGQKQEEESEDSCARVSAVLVPRKDSKSHLRVRRVVNTWGPQTTGIDPGSIQIQKIKQEDKEKPFNSQTGVSERLNNIEEHLQLKKDGPVPSDIYARLKRAEERILYLESISPEYFSNQSVTSNLRDQSTCGQLKRKKVYTASELRSKLAKLSY